MRDNKRLIIHISNLLIVLLLGLSLGGLAGTGGVAAAPIVQDQWIITSPREGSTVSGEVQIIGTATHSNFGSYGIFYAPGAQATAGSQWVTLAFGVTTPVINGVLATWDTTQIPNGEYVLVVVLFEAGATQPYQEFTNNIKVNNSNATPTPTPTTTPEAEAAPETTPIPPGEAPDAPVIQQPPTSTPRPTPTLAPDGVVVEDTDDGSLGLGELFSVDQIVDAATLGVKIAFLLFAMGGLYALAKAVVRYYLRTSNEDPFGE